MTNAVITAQQGSLIAETGFKNRVINGDMRIDQRNVGTAVTTLLQTGKFSVDRWWHYGDAAGKLTLQQSSVAPPGFVNSLLATVVATDPTGPQQFIIQNIEGYNIADFAWGTPSAAAASLSFWVRSNISGQFGGAIQNYSTSRSYPFAYTINSANTWEYKTIIVAPDTVGPWQTANNVGLRLLFELGSGYQKTSAGSWTASTTTSALGSTNLCATLGATWQVTGVQLEAGSVATGFDNRFIGTEFNLCLRYYEKSFPYATIPNNSTGLNFLTTMVCWAGTGLSPIPYKVTKRTSTVVVRTYGSGGWLGFVTNGTLPTTQSAITWATNLNVANMDETKCGIGNNYSQSTLFNIYGGWTADAEFL